ncbi:MULTISPECIES: arginine decarboxylase [Reichenbachiella]|uniref:Arginine decarboxylase n=1 Tax=Reichenbachiella agariperforans TaxID=156994 RepID=A0A1M6M635_REIAG|nr:MULTISPECIES: arginine decarboxylase [Reichenbachiella]MBU2914494.1 arginine decarboxylase [Reichenbachiella agariperforans]RJE73913.1 arginine decarboxylase [Reichenbachiella sp. MSK19-1]SHJ78926.1 arginine decarboxylase [Reichenbachiella agariperforans]
MNKYIDLIDQTFYFPTKEFEVKDDNLFFHGVDLQAIINEYGTPLKLTYLPKISEQIQNAKQLFKEAMERKNYQGKYTYCYCTKSSHFQFVVEEALKNDIHLETSSAYDISIIKSLYAKKQITKETYIVCNGFKRPLYVEEISGLLNDGFKNCLPILDNMKELEYYEQHVNDNYQMGLRVASDEEPSFSFYTSRLGIRYNKIVDFYEERIKGKTKGQLKMLHYFINTGIKDTAYYWNELSRFVNKYCELKKVCPEIESIDIGGGFPIKNSLHFEYDYAYMVDQIVEQIQSICKEHDVPTPNIFTEFGSYTVGESGANIYSVLDQKLQNDKELWYMMDGSFITHMPDVWGLNTKFTMLPINLWNNDYHRVNIGGLTCDSMDYYDSEAHIAEVFLPKIKKEQSLYFGFFNTGAYQESLGGYGGIQHCLIPAAKHVIIEKDADGNMVSRLFAPEQSSEQMLKILGY